MNFEQYEQESGRTRNPQLDFAHRLAAAGLGLTGEAGESADLIKKHLYHGHPLDRDKLVKELGDVLWYMAEIADLLGVSLSEVADRNIAKLKARYPDGFSQQASLNRPAD